MQGITRFPLLYLLLALFSFNAAAQSVSSASMGSNQSNCNAVQTVSIQGLLPTPCTSVSSTFNIQGSYINIYLSFTAQSGSCTQVQTPFTQNVIIGVISSGSYIIRCYNSSTGMQMCTNQSCNVSCNGNSNSCLAPTTGQLYASLITYNSIRINCNTISGAVYYQFLYRLVGSSYWYSAPYSSQNWWNMTGLNSNSNYEYRCRIYCSNGWTGYSPSQYCSTQNQQPTGGSSCSSSIALTCGVTYSGSNNSGTNSYSNYYFPNGTQFGNMTGAESFHYFTLTSTSNVTISLTGLSQNLHLFLLSNCNSNCNVTGCMGYSCNSGNSNEQMTMNNLAPGTYTVLVDGWQGAHCNYNLTVQCNAVITCTAPTSTQCYTSNGTSNSIRLNCSAPGSYYDWSYRVSGGAWIELPSTTQNYYDLTNLQAGVTYQFIVAIRCYNTNTWSNWSPICYCTTPANAPGSSCSNAIVVTCGSSYGGNNGSGNNNYNSYSYNGQSSTESGREVIYQIVVSDHTSLTIGLTGLAADLDLFLLSSCTGNNSVMGQSGTSGNSNESMTVNDMSAGTYYIVVDGWNGAISNFLLTVSCSYSGGGNGNGNGNNGSPTNNEPCGAQVIYANTTCQLTNGNTTGSTTTTNPVAASGCNSTNMQDVWYAVQMPSTGRMRVTMGAGTMTNGLIGIYGGSNCSYLNCYGCVDNTNGNEMPEVTITGSVGIWIYLRVWGYNGTAGTFTICVTAINTNSLQAPDNVTSFDVDADNVSERTSGGGEKLDVKPELSGFALQVFPVPAQDEINFSAILPVDKEVEIRIFDLNGRLVKEMSGLQSVSGNLSERMQVGELPTGLYIVKVRAGETELTRKFSKI